MHQAYKDLQWKWQRNHESGKQTGRQNSADVSEMPPTREEGSEALQFAPKLEQKGSRWGKLSPTPWMPFTPSHCGVLAHGPRAEPDWIWLSLQTSRVPEPSPKWRGCSGSSQRPQEHWQLDPLPSRGCHRRTSLWLAQEEKTVLVAPVKTQKKTHHESKGCYWGA